MLLHTDSEPGWSTCTGGMSARLLVFITASIVIHSLLLFVQSHSTTKTIQATFGDKIIHVSLAPPAEKSIQAKPLLNKKLPNENKTTPARTPAAVKKNPQLATMQAIALIHKSTPPHSTTNNAPNPIAHTPAPIKSIKPFHRPENNKLPPNHKNANSLSTAQAKKNHHNYLLGQVRSLLSRHLIYPPRARRRGWEGEVLVGFHVNEKGQLNNVRLAHSSGYSLLDRSALLAITKIKAIPLPQHTSPPQAMDLQLPVIYQLNEG